MVSNAQCSKVNGRNVKSNAIEVKARAMVKLSEPSRRLPNLEFGGKLVQTILKGKRSGIACMLYKIFYLLPLSHILKQFH